MTDKLKPCPFCGDAFIIDWSENCDNCNNCECQKCGAIAQDAEAWNTRADDWQPIETAPKDVEKIIGMRGNSIFKLYRHEDCSGYFESEWLTFDDDDEFNPTHWKYLPEPPKKGEE